MGNHGVKPAPWRRMPGRVLPHGERSKQAIPCICPRTNRKREGPSHAQPLDGRELTSLDPCPVRMLARPARSLPGVGEPVWRRFSVASSRRDAPTAVGIATSRRCRPPSDSGVLGSPSRCLNAGRSAGGSPSPSITTRGASWASRCLSGRRRPWRSGHSSDGPSAKLERCRNT